jgi:hypothetical protein
MAANSHGRGKSSILMMRPIRQYAIVRAWLFALTHGC